MTKQSLRVRYAPSPTGHLHIGGARTALFDYLMAKANNGTFVIRFEDTDQSRHVESGVKSQLDGLKWLGLDWDESVDVGGPYAPYRQTERLDLYQPYIAQLLQQGNAYYCYCTEHELDEERLAQEAQGVTPMYSGKCRHLNEAMHKQYESEGRKPSIRFQVNSEKIISFTDRIRGLVEFESMGIGDFIIVRPDGIPTYNFAVVLDDHLMNIQLVIRGEEHLSNTPRQIMLYLALDLPVPAFAHLSLILNKDRKKMSKRDESIIQFIEQYQALGYLPEAVLNFIALLGWSPKGEEEIFSKQELIEQFDLDRVSKSPAVFDMDKLNWMNNHYIKLSPLSRIVELSLPHLQKAGYISLQPEQAEMEWVSALVHLFQDRMAFASQIVDLSRIFFQTELEWNDEAQQLLSEACVKPILTSFLAQLQSSDEYTLTSIAHCLKQVQLETSYKGKPLFMTIRVATTGELHGADLNMTLFLLGRSKVIERVQKLL